MRSLRTYPAFSLVVLLTLGLFALFGVVLLRPELVSGLLGRNMVAHISRHFREPHHRIHDLAFSFIVATAAVGMFAQLRTPSKNVAGQLMALIPWVVLMLVFVVTKSWVFAPAPLLAGLTLAATTLHPRRRDLFSFFSLARTDRVMLALVTIAAVPLLAFASNNIELQRTATNDHAELGHYGFIAAFSFTLIGVGLLTSLRPDGWRVTAWVSGMLAVFLGVASLVFRDLDSSLELIWALAAIAWGGTFVVAAEFFRRGDRARVEFSGNTGAELGSGSTSAPGWAYVFAIIAVVLAVLFVVQRHLDRGGLRLYTP
jgi:hypothetical protein